MLQPNRVKYRRPHGLSYEGLSKGGNYVAFGEYGLQATEGNYITNREIESGKVYIRIFPHLGKTKKPAEVRMGSGKGSIDAWVAVVKKNRVMFEIEGVDEATACEALRQASYKLPVKTRIVRKGEGDHQ